MKDLFLPYELALIAKQKGFNEPCFGKYNQDGVFSFQINASFAHNLMDINVISAPLYQQVIDWLETKGIYIELLIDGFPDNTCYRAFIWQKGQPVPEPHDDLGAGEKYEILNIAINEAFKLI